MARLITTLALVVLPRMDANATIALVQACLNLCKRRKLAGPIKASVAKLKKSFRALERAAGKRLPGAVLVDPEAGKNADRRVDSCWRSLSLVLQGWAELPNSPLAAQAQAILDQLFPDKLAFIALPFKKEWAESKARLGEIDARGFVAIIEALGAGPILVELRKAHKAYGDVLGLTGDTGVDDDDATTADDAGLRVALDGVQAALRSYVVQATALGDADSKPSKALSRALLKPIESIETHYAKPDEPVVTDPPPPAQPAPPGTSTTIP